MEILEEMMLLHMQEVTCHRFRPAQAFAVLLDLRLHLIDEFVDLMLHASRDRLAVIKGRRAF